MDLYNCSKTFITVVDTRSFTKTSKIMFKTHSSISKQITWLEHKLNVQLLTRNTRRLSLTEAGEKYYNRILPLLKEWELICSDVEKTNQLPTGVLRIATPTIAGNHYISRYLDRFLQQYPKLKVEFYLGCRDNFLDNQIDVYIGNYLLGKEETIKTVKMSEAPRKLYAAPSYLEKYGEPKKLKDLETHNCLINSSASQNKYWRFKNKNVPVDGNFLANNSESLVKAAVAGIGIIYISESYVSEEVESNLLKPLLPKYHSEDITFYISYPSCYYTPMKTQVFIDFLKQTLA